MSTKIRVIVKSFGPPLSECFPPHSRKIALPEKKVIYTVLRSPHVHKKSREQFETRVQTHVLDIEAKRNELHHKLFWLKRHSIIGSEFEIQVFSKTRLDPKLLPLPQRKRWYLFSITPCLELALFGFFYPLFRYKYLVTFVKIWICVVIASLFGYLLHFQQIMMAFFWWFYRVSCCIS